VNKVTSASLGYSLSVCNKNSTLRAGSEDGWSRGKEKNQGPEEEEAARRVSAKIRFARRVEVVCRRTHHSIWAVTRIRMPIMCEVKVGGVHPQERSGDDTECA